MNHKLFNLIKSLSKNEKGYFKKFASIYSKTESIYFAMFDEIDKQKVFDEESIKVKLFSQNAKTNNYNVAKNYLYNIILKSLRSFHSEKKASQKVNLLFNNIEILYQKKLLKQCSSELKKLKKIIYEYELYNRSSELLIWERRILALKGFSPKLDKLEEEIYKERNHLKKLITDFDIYTNIQYKLYSLTIQAGKRRNKDVIKKLDALVSNDLFQNDDKDLSNRVKIIHYNTKCKYYEFIGDEEKFYYYSEKFITTLEENPFLIKENIENLVNGLYNLLIASTNLKLKEKFYFYFRKFNEIPKTYAKYSSKELQNLIAFYALNLLLQFLISIEDFESANDLDVIELPLKENKMKGVFKLIYIELLYFTSYVSFNIGNHIETQSKLQRLLNNPNLVFRKDILLFSKLLDIINHYELENYLLVSNLVDTLKNNISKQKTEYKFDKQVLKMISQLVKMKTKKQKHSVYLHYLEIFNKLRENKIEQHAFDHLNIVKWITTKLIKI